MNSANPAEARVNTGIKTWSTPVKPEEKRPIPCTLCGGFRFKASLSCEGFSYVRCTACGLVQINPQPLKEEIIRRYNQGKEYLSYELANEEAYLKLQLLALEDTRFGDLERELLSGSKPRVLDIGCATGKLLSRFRDRGWETVGVEISALQAEYGKRERKLDIRSLFLEDNHFSSSSFDVILASHLAEHLNDPASMIREVRRILTPGGRFFITTPNMAGFQARIFGSRWRSAIFDHLYLFSAKTLSRMIVEAGFTIEKTVTWGGLAAGTVPAPVKHLFDKAAKRFGFGDVMIIRSIKNNENEV